MSKVLLFFWGMIGDMTGMTGMTGMEIWLVWGYGWCRDKLYEDKLHEDMKIYVLGYLLF